jgi:integrase
MQMLSTNPADAVKPPRYVRPHIKTATRSQLAQLMVAIDQSPWRIPILIAMTTAMRRGEICGLKWEDFSADRASLAVQRAIVQVPGEVITKEPKTGRSRVISIPRSIVAELSDWHKQQLATGAAQDGWICTHTDGRLITPESVGKGFMRLTRSVGISVTLHGLRHTQATELIMAGVPVKVVSERLGHANVGITQDDYTHVMPHMQDVVVDIIDQMIRNQPPKIKVVDGEC